MGHMPGMFRIVFPSAVMGEVGLPENIFFLVDFQDEIQLLF